MLRYNFGSEEPKITQHDTLAFLRLYRSIHFAEVPLVVGRPKDEEVRGTP